MEKITFNNCPFCGGDPEILHDKNREDEYFVCSCVVLTCPGFNRRAFMAAEACAAWWNSQHVPNTGDENGETDETDTTGTV